MSEAHRCPFPGCHTDVPAGQLACAPHWRLVPVGHQAAVWTAWRARVAARKTWAASRSKVDLAALARAAKVHQDVCGQAIAAAARAAA